MSARLIHVTTTDISLELLLGPQLSAFANGGYEVITMSAPGPFVDAIRARGIEHIALKHATRSMDLRSDLAALRELYQAFQRLRPDVVHTHNPKPGIYGRIAARAARVPVVVNTVHGLYATPTDSLQKRIAVYSAERLASVASDAELVQNPEDVTTLRSLRIPASKIVPLGNGVDLDRFTPPEPARRDAARAAMGVDPTDVVVGAVGRLVAEKGYPELFEAWKRIADQHANARLVVIGPDEPSKADALDRATVNAARGAGVIFLGIRDDVEELYCGMDLYVLASHREGFPRSAMEAAACCLPIVATDIRGCRQVVDDGVTGRLVPVRDPRGLAEAIGSLIEDEAARDSMSVKARQRAEQRFDQRQIISTTLSTYRRLGVGKL